MTQYSELQIVGMEERLRQAMLKSDVAELDALIAPELIFTSYLGQLVSKEEDLAIHRSGVLDFRSLMPSDRHIQCNEGFSVVSVHIVGSYAGAEVDQNFRFTRVWALSSVKSLQIVAGHVGMVSA
jgi:Domain of unknown function (DUF4440)